MLIFGHLVPVLLLLCGWGNKIIDASIGDRSEPYEKCLSECKDGQLGCPKQFDAFGWWWREECFSCRYDCIWSTVEQFTAAGYQIPQFHGKWPFTAIRLGSFGTIQEPASFIFSFLNLASCIYFLRKIGQLPKKFASRSIWRTYCIVGCSTWICSILFHVCDIQLTEHLDYFAAFALVLASFYVSCVRVLLYPNPPKNVTRFLFAALFAFFVYHVHFLFMIRFDYGYNIAVNVGFGLASAVLWLSWSFYEWRKRRRTFASILPLLQSVGIGLLAIGFEVLDFAPIFWVFDAHSLFHAFTVPCAVLLARFVEADAMVMLRDGDRDLWGKAL